MRVVAPFRPFPPEIGHHEQFGHDWWMDAIAMMRHSASRACNAKVMMLTDVDTTLPFPCLQYRTNERRLMLWYLEIACRYLSSCDFDQDTVMLDSDQLVYQDLSRWFRTRMDLGLLVRRRTRSRDAYPIINGVQFWPIESKLKLATFYRAALSRARQLPESMHVWGADTVALTQLLAPVSIGSHHRAGLRVRLIESDKVSKALSTRMVAALKAKQLQRPNVAVLDFRHTRKQYMRAVFEDTLAPHIGHV